MGSYQPGREYDVVLAGGGTAACVVAGRLAEADPSLAILLVERGPNNLDDAAVLTPALYRSHLLPGSKTTIFYKANREAAINGRQAVVPAGGVLGGGSSINFMMYTRAQACDYDSWNARGWGADSLLPLARKLETFHFQGPQYDASLHGYDGPIHVSRSTYGSRAFQDDIMAAAEAVGEREVPDLQDFRTASGFSRWGGYISPQGQRQDAAHRYVHPLIQSGRCPNLHVLVETTVSRVLFQGTRAVGVEALPTGAGPDAKPLVVRARRLVVVSAGALGTPQILERSGVGSRAVLAELGIPVVSDLPGVGEDYQDHNLAGYGYKSNLSPDETLDGLISGRLDVAAAVRERNPILGWNGLDVAAKVRPTDEEVAEMGPDFQRLWDRDFKRQTERPLMLFAVASYFLGDPALLGEATGGGGGGGDDEGPHQCVTVGCYTAYPYSRGSIHIVSRDASAAPSFNTGFLSHPADLAVLVWAYKKQRDMMRRTNAFVAEVPLSHPSFEPGSKAALLDRHPVEGGYASLEDRRHLPPVEYDERDNAAIEEHIRSGVGTAWHSCGTCKMAPRDKGGVVDEALNVYGTEGLKLADLSICPENVGANTNNTALIVGEKAAWIIGRELGLSISPLEGE
ncbi:uncharacterized protein UV8b_04768 [Ustilaginoidea virens]|uniref:Glucose-methanol-choline oxidoreductase N-terminal domain-containing protein n=1 Tax=Ustilaginoidea virens TaxID=1159556 RepID=A0A8E5MIF7_USTVR|nr:uncharacterized protein UV8b_04768 [Ustilaginoidea virens]QUC20527.1 hypothetical protein UV8b_04768 [Ustilaginoidea virens]